MTSHYAKSKRSLPFICGKYTMLYPKVPALASVVTQKKLYYPNKREKKKNIQQDVYQCEMQALTHFPEISHQAVLPCIT